MSNYKQWKYMTDEEKGALLISHHKGELIMFSFDGEDWQDVYKPSWGYDVYYRTSTHTEFEHGGYIFTYNKVNGVPDFSSVTMREDA